MAAANAHIFSTAVEHSKAVVVDTAHIGQHDDKEQLSEDQQALPEVATYQEQELPEGVTVTKWEEWAYVRRDPWQTERLPWPVPLLQR